MQGASLNTSSGVDPTRLARNGYLKISGPVLEPIELFANCASDHPGFGNSAVSNVVNNIRDGIFGMFFPDP